MKRGVAILFGLALLFEAGLAGAYRAPRYGGSGVVPLPSRPLTWDAARMTRLGEWQLARLVYDGLMRLPYYAPGPVLHMARWKKTQPGGLRVRLGLRRGMRSHRGQLVRAADVVASFKRLSRATAGWVVAGVRQIKAVGLDGVELELHRPHPELAWVLAAPTTVVTPGGLAPGRRPDGTGAFRFVRGGLDRGVVLSAYSSHFAGRPYLDKLTLRAYPRARDEISAFYLGRTLLSLRGKRLFGKTPRFRTRRSYGRVVSTVALITGRSGILRRRRVRQAIYLAVDKERLRKLVTGAPTRPAHGPVPPALQGTRARRRARRPAPYSSVKARFLLRATPFASGKVPLRLLVDQSRHRHLAAARKIMTDLAGVGMRVTVQPVKPAAFARTVRRGAFDLALTQVSSPVPRSRYHLAAMLAAAGQRPRARAVIRARWARLSRRLKRFMRDLPCIPLFHVGLRLDVSKVLAKLRPGPLGLLDWANVQFE